MRRMGKVLHITPSKKVVVKAENLPKIGDRVFDEKRDPVGTVFDIFGSTSSPYVAVKPDVEDPHRLVDYALYVRPTRKSRKKPKRGKNR